MSETHSPIADFRKAAEPKLTLESLGSALGVNKSTILRWEKGSVPIPAERVSDVERVTGIPRHQLRPDIYPAPAVEVAA